MSAVVTFGETMALFAPASIGRLSNGTELTLGIGGAESNLAIGLSRLGVDVTWIGRVGADPLGDLVTREVRAEGVDVRAIVDQDARTGLMVKERRVSGASRVLYYRAGSAGSRLQPDDIEPSLISGAQILHVTGITPALSASAAETTRHAIRLARASGVLVSLDVNYRSALWSRQEAHAALSSMLPEVNIVFAGLEEAPLLTGSTSVAPDAQAALISAAGPQHAIIKLGAEGAFARIGFGEFEVPPVPVHAIDTVGAGDAFAAGYLADIVHGADAETALTTAATAGAFACLTHGDWEGLPTRAELELLNPARDPIAR